VAVGYSSLSRYIYLNNYLSTVNLLDHQANLTSYHAIPPSHNQESIVAIILLTVARLMLLLKGGGAAAKERNGSGEILRSLREKNDELQNLLLLVLILGWCICWCLGARARFCSWSAPN
jgi:hypothetical protein